MGSSNFEIKYENKKFQQSEKFLKIFVIAGPLTYLIFGIADYYKYPNQLTEFISIRLVFCILTMAMFFINRKTLSFLSNQIFNVNLALIASAGISIMLYSSEGPSSSYYAGINLTALFTLMTSALSTRFFYLALTAAYLPYYTVCVLQYDKFSSWNEFFVLNIFNAGTIVCLTLNHYKRESDLKTIVNTELALESELVNREKIILQKTEEATQLNQLSSQFSPQVVAAIKSGNISIDKDVQRAKICALFIDIVKSTDKVTTLNESDVRKSLERFLDSTLTTFLKYDLTIDKFHGDGVLAYSNMPINHEDYIERTCIAAYEAVQLIQLDAEFYKEHWKSELQVRVGIAVGYANVGFYGNKKYFKTFTAIGSPLPYASRLTSIALPNQILVDHEIASKLSLSNFEIVNCGAKLLKGFESNSNSVFELVATPFSSHLNKTETLTCPVHISSVLYLDTTSKGEHVYKCRDCNYRIATLLPNTNSKPNAA